MIPRACFPSTFLAVFWLMGFVWRAGAAQPNHRPQNDNRIDVANATAPNPNAHSILKKGFPFNGKDPNLASKFSALGAGWFYTWHHTRPENLDQKFVFTPMIWGKHSAEDEGVLGRLKKIDPQRDSGALLGFNEPDWKQQANMPVETALDLWPALQATGRRLGSPAMAQNPLKDGSWLRLFLEGAQKRNYRVDFIALHWYGPPNPNKFLEWVDQVHEAFGKPIWITEFAVADWDAKHGGSTRYSVTEVEQFMKTAIPGLEKRDFVEHYFWFSPKTNSAVMGTSALFNNDGSLTEVGKLYSKF